MAVPKQEQFETQNDLRIAPSSYHVFPYEDSFFLFDRGTGGVFEVSEPAFGVLKSVADEGSLEKGLQEYASRQGTAADLGRVSTFLAELSNRGLFREPVLHDQDKHLRRLLRHRPRRMQLLLTAGCNLGCRYCYEWRNGANAPQEKMSWDIARQCVDFLVKRSGNRKSLQLTFFGGEPLLNWPVLRRVVAYCREQEKRWDKTFVFELITNGTLLTKEITDFIVKEKFLLFISIDGCEEMHNYQRPAISGENLYPKLLENAFYANQEYVKHGLPKVKVRANLTHQFPDCGQAVDYLESLGFLLIGVGPIEPLPHGDSSNCALDQKQMDDFAEDSRRKMMDALSALKSGRTLGPHMRKQFNSLRAPFVPRAVLGISCGLTRNTLIADTDGELFPCHRYAGMDAFNVGNIFTGVDKDRVLTLYRRLNRYAQEHCFECWIRDYCVGGCAWLLSDMDGNIHHPVEAECDRRRKSVEDGLWLRQELRKSLPGFLETGGSEPLDCWDWQV